jgi:putative two-component system response regulator
MRRVIERLVTATGHPVETAASAAEARDWLAAAPFSLVICDAHMPGESGSDLARWVRETQPDVAIVMATGTNDPELADETLAFGAYGFLVKPFKRNEVAINVANALLRRRLEIENREHRELLEERVAERTSALRDAIQRLEVAQQHLKRSRAETISRLSLAIEFRSNETGQHVERIGHAAQRLSRRLGYDESWCETIKVSAVLHDVGKIGIPDGILLKPDVLTADERRRMQDHAEIGYRLLAGSGIELLEVAAKIARTHHERVDGTGYPNGLARDEIPIEGRITAVADVFDALTHDRLYRPALPLDDALEIMRGGRGTQFDAGVLDTFLASREDWGMTADEPRLL